jgi:glycosyltransferase involved in cell wall biosynthesis
MDNIWIINEYAGNPNHGMTLRHYYLAKAFQKKGFHSTIISGSYSHVLSTYPSLPKDVNFHLNKEGGIDFLWIKLFKYKGSGHYKRILKWFYFTFRLFFVSKHIPNKPKYIICSPTAPFCIIAAYYLKLKFKAKLVFEVRDIWPLSIVEIGSFSKYHPFILFMRRFELFAINHSDYLVSNLQFYQNYLSKQGITRKSHWVSNAIYLEEKLNAEPLAKSIRALIPKDKFIIGYTGKLGLSNAMNYLIEAVKLIKSDQIHFVIVGDGEEKEYLLEQASQLKNITFIANIPKTNIPDMLSQFDVCYIGWNRESIYNYGVSPNKIFDYMYAGKPIVHSIHLTEEIVSLANCGLRVKEESPEDIARAFMHLFQMKKEERIEMGERGKEYVLEHFTYSQLANKYIKLLENKL